MTSLGIVPDFGVPDLRLQTQSTGIFWLVSIPKKSCPHDFVERRALILFLITDVQPFQVNSSGGWHIDSLDAAIWNDSTSPSKRKTARFAYETIWNRVCYPLKAALHGFRFKKKVPPPLPPAIQPSELRWRILHIHGVATEVETNSWRVGRQFKVTSAQVTQKGSLVRELSSYFGEI